MVFDSSGLVEVRILILGKDGQVGRALQSELSSMATLIALSRHELDLEDLIALRLSLISIKPDIIINAAAYTAVDNAEHEQSRAFLINAEMVGVLAAYAQQHQILLIHYSTDYVFDGKKTTPYCESDPVNPLNIYGLSKRMGEEAIIKSGCEHLIFRTSWVFSAEGKNFINTILKLAKEKDSLRVVSDQFGSPTSAAFIAKVTMLAIKAYKSKSLPTGLYHLTTLGVTNWHELACYVVEKFSALREKLKLEPCQIIPILTEEYPLPAQRPKNSKLNTLCLSEKLGAIFPYWRDDVDRLI